MTEVSGISKHIIPPAVGNDHEFMKQVSLRISDIENRNVDGLDEKKIFEILKR